MKFENILADVNGFGRFQMRMILLMAIPRATLPFHFLLNNFIAVIPSHHCDINPLDHGDVFRNLSLAQRLVVSIPIQEDGTPRSCEMFAEPQYHLLFNSSNMTDAPTVPCKNGWVYDNSTFASTLATQWDLVCDQRRMNKATATIFFIGVMIGAAVFGYLSDRFGRKTILLTAYITTIVFGFASAFANSFPMFAAMRFFTGLGTSGISIISIVLCVEWVDIKHRTTVGILLSMDWSFSTMLLSLAAYLVNDWRYLTVTATAPALLAMITWQWVPESARWLISQGKVRRAHSYLSMCARANHREQLMADLKPETLSKVILVENENKKYSYLDLVKTPKMRRLTLLTGIVWFTVACPYYGISLNITGFGVNMYLTQFLHGSFDMLVKVIILFTLDKFGRRLNQAGTLTLTGVCILCNIFIPREKWLFRTSVAVLGKMFTEASFTTVFLYTAELYPTVIRQNGMGYCSFVARAGVSLAPLIMLLEEVWVHLPSTVFTLVSLTGGLAASFLPETHNVRIPETIEDVEQTRYGREPTMKFENILSDINGFGRFQMMILASNFIGRFTLPCHFMLNNFIAAVPAHHCNFSALDDGGMFRNLSAAERRTVSIPGQEDGTPSSCYMFTEPQYHLLLNSSNGTDVPAVPCQNGWVYDNSTFKSTLTSQWDLVCDKKGKNKATATIFFVGVMFGAVTFGYLSNRFGRRIMLLVSYVSGMMFAVVSSLSTSYMMFAVLRFFTGFCITGIVIVSSILSVEWVDIKHRKLVGVIDSLSWTVGSMGFAAIAYFVTDWRWLIISVTSPLALAIFTWRWIPESARWLIAHGKLDQALTYLQTCAKMNQTEALTYPLKKETLSSIVVTEERDRAYSYLDLVRTPKMRKLCLRTGILWFCVATTFYGISFNIAGFGLNLSLTQFTYASIELPAKLSVYYLLDKIGRRITETGTLLMASLCLGINVVLPKDMSAARTVVAVIGKGFSSASFATLVLYSAELYPTVMRQNGMGYNSCMARLGVAVTPLILLLDEAWKHLPQVVLCSVAALGAIVARTLSETRNRCLPETIEDIEQHW